MAVAVLWPGETPQMLLADVKGTSGKLQKQTDVLSEVLIRAGAWGISTSNVERVFGLLKHRRPKERNRVGESFVRNELAQEHAQLVQAAARVWPKVYGKPRVGSCADGRLRRRRPVDGKATP